MKLRIRRRVRRPPDLTSLFDVLFIVVFVALIRAAAAQHAAAEAHALVQPPRAAPRPPAPPPAVAALRTRALAALGAELAARSPLVIRVSAAGTVEQVEADGKQLRLDAPLLEHDPSPDVEIAYLGDRSAELRVCRIAAVQLGLVDLSRHLVIVSPSGALADLPRALRRGLDRDLYRCFVEQHSVATIVEAPAPPPTP